MKLFSKSDLLIGRAEARGLCEAQFQGLGADLVQACHLGVNGLFNALDRREALEHAEARTMERCTQRFKEDESRACHAGVEGAVKSLLQAEEERVGKKAVEGGAMGKLRKGLGQISETSFNEGFWDSYEQCGREFPEDPSSCRRGIALLRRKTLVAARLRKELAGRKKRR